MADFCITPSLKLEGTLKIPPSKSHTLRALVFASLAKGTSIIKGYLDSPDTYAMIEALRLLGAKIDIQKELLIVEGFNGKPHVPENVIDCGNSGLVLRLIGALAGLIPAYSILTGDASIRHNRPVKPLLKGLTDLGCMALSSRGDDHAPILIKGPFEKNNACLNGEDSQPVSALLIAGAFAPFPITLQVENPGEKPWIDLTLDWFKRLDIPYEKSEDYTFYKLNGCAEISAFTYEVPGDLSSAAFPIAAALLTDSEITLENVDLNDAQGDKILFSHLEEMGAKFQIDSNKRTFSVEKNSSLIGKKIDLNSCIDALPILSVIACFSLSPTEIFNASIARKKESDRISAISQELRKMGAIIEEKEDGLIIYPSKLKGSNLFSHLDHRIAMSLSVAALKAEGKSQIEGIECIQKTYPSFENDFQKMGAKIEVL